MGKKARRRVFRIKELNIMIIKEILILKIKIIIIINNEDGRSNNAIFIKRNKKNYTYFPPCQPLFYPRQPIPRKSLLYSTPVS